MIEITLGGIAYRRFNNIYAVSRCGKVLKYMEPFTPTTKHNLGYIACGRRTLLHRMVATCWLERPDGATHVHHKNGDKLDNRADNLEWLTPKQHKQHHRFDGVYERTAETREKLRQTRLGKTTSEETKQKQRAASLRLGIKPPSWAGKTHTQRTKDKMRASSKKSRPCIVFGVEYPSFTIAGEALGIRPLTLRKRCLSNNFPDYSLA